MSDSEIRQWARDQGLDVSVRGRVGAAVRSAYERAHSGAVTGGETEPAADLTATPDDQPEAPPTPAEIPADPPPHRPSPGVHGKISKIKTPRVTAELKRDIRGKLALVSLMPLHLFRRVDPVCGGSVEEVKDPLLDWAVDAICDSPDLLKWFTVGKGYMRLWSLLTILEPVAVTAFQHHVMHSITAPDEGGENAAPDYVYPATPPAGPVGYLNTDQARDYIPSR